MKLYYASSVCSLAIRIIIHELALDCEYESVDLKNKKTETGKDFFKINPKGSVPVLQLSEHAYLTENAIILQFLADQYRASHLLPAVGDTQRYRVLEWLNFVSTDLHRYTAPLFWSKIPTETKENLFIPILKSKLHIVEKQLEKSKFLSTDSLTVADSYLMVILIWLAKINFKMRDYPHLVRYFSDMKKLPSVKQALTEENLSMLALQN